MRTRPWWIVALLMGWLLQCSPSVWAQGATIRIGAEDDWAPFSGVKNGKPHGMAVELVQAIFSEAGLPLELVSLPYARCLEETRQGRIAGCFNTLPDEQLRNDFWFHAKPLFSDPILILTRSDNPLPARDIKGLEGQRVITTHGYTYGDALEANRTIRRVVASQDINALRMLDAKRGEYALVYQRIANLLLRGDAQQLMGKIRVSGQLTNADPYIAFSRKYPDVESVMRRFDAAHNRLLKNQMIQHIENRWN